MREHPFKAYRRQLHFSLTDMQYHSELTRISVIRTEQGLFSLPPSRYLEVLEERLPVGSADLVKEYDAWVAHKRASARDLVLKGALAAKEYRAGENNSPWQLFWVAAFGAKTSQIGRCKLLCMHPPYLKRYESLVQPYMPGQLKVALHAAGLSLTAVNQLNDAHATWWAIYT